MDGVLDSQGVHELDLTNLYSITREWAVGSCPHLFVHGNGDSHYQYWGELFAENASVSKKVELVVPGGTDELVIAELEEEVTYIDIVRVDGLVSARAVTLVKGETLSIPVRGGQRVAVEGTYSPRPGAVVNPWRRNEVIARFLGDKRGKGKATFSKFPPGMCERNAR
jgi:hypothetical protein